MTKKRRASLAAEVAGAATQVEAQVASESSLAFASTPVKIASVTISNNQETIIGDAIASVVDQVDVVVLVDTGITDATIERAREVAKQKLRVCKHVWKNDFTLARNASLDFARELDATWAIVVDTDERFSWNGVDLRNSCARTTSDVFDVASLDGVYAKEKILRLSQEAGVRYYGPTHEAPAYRSKELLEKATFDELPKTAEQLVHKRKRDLEILQAWVADPENAKDGRWWYYLGDTYQGCGNITSAADAFGQCMARRAPISEEGAYAAYRQADCLIQAGKFQEALIACVLGMSRHAGMAELAWQAALACYKLSWAESKHSWAEQAVYWARVCISIGRYAGCAPARAGFVHQPALYELPYDVLRFALPTDEERRKAETTMRLAKETRLGINDTCSAEELSVSRKPQRTEIRSMLRPKSIRRMLTGTKVVDLEPSYGKLEKFGLGKYHAMNPSLCEHNGELWAVVRLVNYTIENGGYVSSDDDGRIRTRNLLGRLSTDDWSIADFRLVEDKDTGPRCTTKVLGYEDMRVFSTGDSIAASAAVQDRESGRCQIALLEMADGDVVKATVQSTGRWVEKNWMPITRRGGGASVEWLYELDPTVVRTGDGASKTSRRGALALEHLRGGSNVIPFNDGYLCVTHETISMDGWGCRRIYLHRFVRLDAELNVEAVSPTWTFEDGHYGIEFCSGLVRDISDPKKLILGFGVEDRQAKLLILEEEQIRNMEWITGDRK